jgi:hypothetical protein
MNHWRSAYTNHTPDDTRATVSTPGVINAIMARLGDTAWSVQALVELAQFGKTLSWIITYTS